MYIRIGLVISAAFAAAVSMGCRRTPEQYVKGVATASVSDVNHYFFRREPLKISREGRAVRLRKIIAEPEATAGYVEEQWFRVMNDPESSDAQMFMVYDPGWNRRGFITEVGHAYRFRPDGTPERVPSLDFADGVQMILGLRTDFRFEMYDPRSALEAGGAGEGALPGPMN